jgi:hypothetical protein
MVHYTRVIQGVADYVDHELLPALNGSWKAWLLGGMTGIVAAQGDALFKQYKDMPLLASLRLIDGENINVDLIHAEMRKQAQKGTATLSVPAIGPVTFGPSDVEKLFHYIRG